MLPRWLVVPAALLSGAAMTGARADEGTAPAAASSSPPSASAPKKSLRRAPPPPTTVEIVDLGGGRDPQAFAMGAHLGAGYLYNRRSDGQSAMHVSLVGDFGLGEGGARVPWTIEGWISFAVTYGVLFEKGGRPDRFTEFGVRMIYRFDKSWLEGRWVSLGAGAVWTSRSPSSGFFDPSRACLRDLQEARDRGLDCSDDGSISPGALIDLGFGLQEWTVRRARWGFGARVPVQLSHAPGFAAIGFFYAQVGTAL